MIVGKMGNSSSTTAGHTYTSLVSGIETNTDGAEDGFFALELSDGGSLSEKLRVNSSGNVGIGTITPAQKLDVVGRVRASYDANNYYEIGASSSGGFVVGKSGGVEKINIRTYGDSYFNGGNFGIGTESPDSRLDVTGGDITVNVSGTALMNYKYNNSVVGSITTNGVATAFNTSSDYRLKEDLKDFNGLDKVCKIPVYDFKWKSDEIRSYGVMAHELQEVLPQAVTREKDAKEMQSVDYSKIVPLLIKSIQELEAKVKILENK